MIDANQNGLIQSTSEATIEVPPTNTDHLHKSLSHTAADTTNVEVQTSQQKSGDTKNHVTLGTTRIQRLPMGVAQTDLNSHLG